MKNILCVLILVASAGTLSSVFAKDSADNLWNGFVNPPDEARTKVWWFHGETECTREGIDADLQSFREKGVGGVVFYDQVHGKGDSAAPSMSPEWWDNLKYAARKAKELGLTFEVAVGNGYVTGGPWITPELGMKKTAFSDTLITVGKDGRVDIQLPVPDAKFKDAVTVAFPDRRQYSSLPLMQREIKVWGNDTVIPLSIPSGTPLCGISYSMSPRGKGSTGSMNIPGKPAERYFAAMYVDYPPCGQLEYSNDGKTWIKAVDLQSLESNIGHKTRQRTLSFPEVKGKHYRLHIHDWQAGDKPIRNLTLSDITLHTRDVVDNIEVKTGLRTEAMYPSVTGGNAGAVKHTDVIDVTHALSPEGVLNTTLQPGEWRVIRFGYVPTGARTKHGRKNLLGYEADVMSAEAANIQYDNYFHAVLDTLASIGFKPDGMIQDSHEAGIQNWTKGFEQRFADLRGYDLTPWIPAIAGYIVDSREESDRVLRDFRRSIAETIADNYYGTFARRCHEDGVEYTTQAMLNIDNDNIMSRGRADKPQGEFWAYQKNGNYDCLDAASSAHLYGHPIASGEAFTDTPYSESWDELLRIANIAYCRGLNEFVVCASSYQPWANHKFDDSASAHPYVFHRFHHDWDNVKPFWDYQARCAAMLRRGEPVVDLCVYLGEDLPAKTMAYRLPAIPEGYNFDVCSPDALFNRMTGAYGILNVEGGMKYKALLVEERAALSPESEAKLKELADAGVPVIRCALGEDISMRLLNAGVVPDFAVKSACEPDDRLLFFHRKEDGRDIYFVYNHSATPYSGEVRLRDAGSGMEMWNPKSLTRKPLNNYCGKIQLDMAPYESLFIVTEH